MKIDKIKLKNQLILAPMLGVNCKAFRLLCKQHGAALTYTGMIDADEFKEQHKKFIDIEKKEAPIAAQIVGSDIKKIKDAAEVLQSHANIIDINFGCIESRILAKKAGCYYTKHPEQMHKVINAVQESTNKPITAKIRIGWDEINVNETVKTLEDHNIDAIAIHGRTRKQRYTGKANWNVIKEMKDKYNTPIIGSGDVSTPNQIITRTHQADAIMIGRAATVSYTHLRAHET